MRDRVVRLVDLVKLGAGDTALIVAASSCVGLAAHRYLESNRQIGKIVATTGAAVGGGA